MPQRTPSRTSMGSLVTQGRKSSRSYSPPTPDDCALQVHRLEAHQKFPQASAPENTWVKSWLVADEVITEFHCTRQQHRLHADMFVAVRVRAVPKTRGGNVFVLLKMAIVPSQSLMAVYRRALVKTPGELGPACTTLHIPAPPSASDPEAVSRNWRVVRSHSTSASTNDLEARWGTGQTNCCPSPRGGACATGNVERMSADAEQFARTGPERRKAERNRRERQDARLERYAQ